ncbi:hypothetical protein B0J17DRAFT_635465 [Rhizoctonia solani]|nr:hypothetical protein B0J17DRAFT_635465 [Rhizoctonia solani]
MMRLSRAHRISIHQSVRHMSSSPKTPSPHASFYSDTLPAMGPVFLIAFAVYMGLKLAQSRLAHEKFVLDTQSQIISLEQELERLREARRQPDTPGVAPAVSGGAKSWYTWGK